jgi:mannose-1-phosphate guanylyltransferase
MWRDPNWSLVLAGGDGTRLQDLTRELVGRPIPKQYCRLCGDRSLLEMTIDRAHRFSRPRNSLVVVNRNHLEVGAAQLAAVPGRNLVIQPCNRDTGPGIVFSLLDLAKRKAGIVAVLPSDHYVSDDALFMEHVAAARRAVAQWPDKVALLGIRPERPDPELGYISVGEALRPWGGLATVRSFVEKPTEDEARELIASGSLWNSFVMVFRAARMLELLADVVPAELERIRNLCGRVDLSASYGELPAWNFSRDFLSRISEHLMVVPVDGLHWSDLGTRAAVERIHHTLAAEADRRVAI